MQMLWLKGLQKEAMGNVFETSIFAELVKKYSADALFYWRTKDKKEIDFIVRSREQILPIEAKLTFERSTPLALRYFTSHYDLKEYRIVALQGKPGNQFQIYPWDL
jgi:predicted AAA+ superfamily ATPase